MEGYDGRGGGCDSNLILISRSKNKVFERELSHLSITTALLR